MPRRSRGWKARAGCCSATRARRQLDRDWNINGATNAIAGILNERGNVLGMMPHPENHVEAAIGRTDGRGLFAGLVDHFAAVAA